MDMYIRTISKPYHHHIITIFVRFDHIARIWFRYSQICFDMLWYETYLSHLYLTINDMTQICIGYTYDMVTIYISLPNHTDMIQIYPWYTVDIHIGLARLWYDSNMSPIWFRYGTDMVVRSYHLNRIGMIGKWYVYRNHIMSISDTYLNHINLHSGMQYGWGPKYVYF